LTPCGNGLSNAPQQLDSRHRAEGVGAYDLEEATRRNFGRGLVGVGRNADVDKQRIECPSLRWVWSADKPSRSVTSARAMARRPRPQSSSQISIAHRRALSSVRIG
jgi:hypothetical protein